MNPPRSEGFVRMPDAEFEAILTRAAEEGAKRALADVGLEGDEAALDIRDLRSLAVIPPRKNAKPWKTVTAGAVARNEALRASKYLGRALWRRWSGYHRRSRVETKMHCVKLLGQRLMARDFDR